MHHNQIVGRRLGELRDVNTYAARWNDRLEFYEKSWVDHPEAVQMGNLLAMEWRERGNLERSAQAYLDFLYSKEGQEIEARNFYRPRDPEVAARYTRERSHDAMESALKEIAAVRMSAAG